MSINNFFDRYGVEITVSNESDSRKLIALPNKDCDSNREYFGFLPKDIVKVGEIISDSIGNSYKITEVKPMYGVQGSIMQIMAYYKNLDCIDDSQLISNITNYNISNATNSIIGSQHNFSISTSNFDDLKSMIEKSNSSDKEELNKLVDLVLMIVDNHLPANKGILSRFASVIQRNSWITSPLMSLVFDWMIHKNL